MKLEDMTPELMEQAKQCETPEECMAFMAENDIELRTTSNCLTSCWTASLVVAASTLLIHQYCTARMDRGISLGTRATNARAAYLAGMKKRGAA